MVKEISPNDLTEFMDFHYRKIFQSQFLPKKFCYPIRRPHHNPEGIFSIERNNNESISVILKEIEEQNSNPIEFSINDATQIQIGGKKYIHTLIDHCFETNEIKSLNLIARARQFSCFILVIGNLQSSSKINVQHAIIIQNKDDLLIPILFGKNSKTKRF